MDNWLSSEIAGATIRFFSVPEDANFWTLINSPFLVALIATMIGFRLNARLTRTQRELNTQLTETQSDADTALRIATENIETELDHDLFDSESVETRFSPRSASADQPDMSERMSPSLEQSAKELDEMLQHLDEELSGSESVAAAIDDVTENPELVCENTRREAEKIADQARARINFLIDRDRDGRHQRTYDKISRRNPIALVIALNERGQISDKETNNLIDLFKMWNKHSKGRAANSQVPTSVVAKMKKLSSAP
ncbi:hypothetical protein [Hyphomonas sp.]|uniref:hypothetical protein n=1 Tax=Hyphomonas sp. TaxID=87 RepID=UPI002610113E|nr:hypothetical protein [Hyphomonas sp.]MDF1805273.1 hypothetical protein [Hyphomonas sp.]